MRVCDCNKLKRYMSGIVFLLVLKMWNAINGTILLVLLDCISKYFVAVVCVCFSVLPSIDELMRLL